MIQIIAHQKLWQKHTWLVLIHNWFILCKNDYIQNIYFCDYLIQSILFLAPTNSNSQPDSTLIILNKVKTEVKTWNRQWSSPPEQSLKIIILFAFEHVHCTGTHVLNSIVTIILSHNLYSVCAQCYLYLNNCCWPTWFCVGISVMAVLSVKEPSYFSLMVSTSVIEVWKAWFSNFVTTCKIQGRAGAPCQSQEPHCKAVGIYVNIMARFVLNL